LVSFFDILLPMSAKQDNTSATLRAIAVLEIIVRADRPVSLTEVMAEVALPKPTVYRILTLIEHAGLLLREPDGKRYTVGPRLARFGAEILMNSSVRGSRHAIARTPTSQRTPHAKLNPPRTNPARAPRARARNGRMRFSIVMQQPHSPPCLRSFPT